MADFKRLAKKVLLGDGVVDAKEVKMLRRELLADRSIDGEEVDFLVDLRNSQTQTTEEFDAFFFEAMEIHVLADGSIDKKEVTKLRKIIMADDKVDPNEKKFLLTLKQKAKSVVPEFDQLLDEAMKK